MGTLKYFPGPLVPLFLLIFIYSCASERHFITERARPEELSGTFTLFLYGARHSDDVANVAILDREGDPYEIQIYAPEFDFSVKKGLSADDALAEAASHVKYHRDFIRSRLAKIIDDKGDTIGYELRPLYHI
ncbi:MAG: hypothetical protein AB1499_14495, partial [Nitrospirota bacterium]